MYKTYYFYSESNDITLLTKAENIIEANIKFTNRIRSFLCYDNENILNYEIKELDKNEVIIID